MFWWRATSVTNFGARAVIVDYGKKKRKPQNTGLASDARFKRRSARNMQRLFYVVFV